MVFSAEEKANTNIMYKSRLVRSIIRLVIVALVSMVTMVVIDTIDYISICHIDNDNTGLFSNCIYDEVVHHVSILCLSSGKVVVWCHVVPF